MNIHAHPDLVDRLAASYALGTLRGGARRRFESLARQHPAVRAAGLLWQERLAALTELQAGQAPSPNVWKRIENLLALEARPAAAPSAPAADAGLLASLSRRLAWWRGGAWAGLAASLVAAVAGVMLNQAYEARGTELAQARQQAQQLGAQVAQARAQLEARPDIQYVAVLADDKAAPSVLVTFDPRRGTLTLKRVGDFQEGPDRSLELWALPAQPGAGPRSLGVLDGGGVVRLTAAEAQVSQTPALAISLEPKGGVPPGSGPTGPILFKGALLRTGV